MLMEVKLSEIFHQELETIKSDIANLKESKLEMLRIAQYNNQSGSVFSPH